MGIYITQYKEDGIVKEGPCILAHSWENALEQAYYFNLEIVGRINPTFIAKEGSDFENDYRVYTNDNKV